MYIEKINSPAKLKELSVEEMYKLGDEIRHAILTKVSKIGVHVGPNLGVVELTMALHYVFDSPIDKIIFDVSHQSYTHKILTGRNEEFLVEEKYRDISNYTNPLESEHDHFIVGHTSTSIGLATGMAKARDIKGEKSNVIALIGDASLGGGEALEGLVFARELGSNLIIILNDNDMSIAENHGGLFPHLKELRDSKGKSPNNLFKALGLDYIFVEDGHDLNLLIKTLSLVKDSARPVLLHIPTQKGRGYKLAETELETWHWHAPFNMEDGSSKHAPAENYAVITAEYLLAKMDKDSKVVALTAGTPAVFGFNRENRLRAGKQFVDVGICEEHATAMISGMAKNGAKPVFAVSSTFIQRTYDQLSHDLCMNDNPATILVFGGTVYSGTEITHHGYYDIAMISNIPNLVYLAPTTKEEYLAMLDWAIDYDKHPVAIRVPGGAVVSNGFGKEASLNFDQLGKFETVKAGKDIAIIAAGAFFGLGAEVAQSLNEKGLAPTLINPRFLTHLDNELLDALKVNHKLVITLEDGILNGGFGEKIASYYGSTDMKVLNYGLEKKFKPSVLVKDNLVQCRLTNEQIVEDIEQCLR